MTLFHILTQTLDILPGTSHLHQPVKVIVDATGISLVDFDHRQEILVGHEHLILMIKQTGKENPAPQVLLELASCREQLLNRRFLLVIAPLQRWRLLSVFGPSYVREEDIQLLQSTSKPR